MEIHTTIAGLNFRPASAKEAVDALEIGDELRLEADFDNEYDPNAVKVIADVGRGDSGPIEEFIGFIPKTDNWEIATAIREGATPIATVVAWEGTRKPTLKVTLRDGIEPGPDSE
jgi:hypothetical protein